MLVGGPDAPPSLLDGSGLPLGLAAQATYPSRHAALPAGASLVLVSDGLLETRAGGGPMLDDAALSAAACRAAREPSAAGIVNAMLQDFNLRVGGPPQDDLSVVCVRC